MNSKIEEIITKNKTIVAITIVAILVVGSVGVYFAIDNDESDGAIVNKPDKYVLNKETINFQDSSSENLTEIEGYEDKIILTEENYEGLSILAPAAMNKGVLPLINWGEGQSLDYSDLSTFSSTTAITFCEEKNVDDYSKEELIKSGKAIVVDNYENALNVVPIANFKNIPILIQGGTTEEALYRLGTIYPEQIIVYGNTDYNEYSEKGVTVLDNITLLNFTIKCAIEAGININYITVINPNDINQEIADVPHLSAFGSILAVHRNSIILTCDADNKTINSTVHNAVEVLDNNGMKTEYICMVGDSYSLPFIYMPLKQLDDTICPTDNVYADLDGDPYTIEIAIGRIIGKTLADVSFYMDRVFNYNSYLEITTAPNYPNRGAMGENWNNNGLTYCATAAEFAGEGDLYVNEQLYEGDFDTQDDSPQGHTGYWDTVISSELLTYDFARANYIIMDADHGNPYRTANFWGYELKPMHPGVFFAVSCSLGRIDLRGYGENHTNYPDDEWGFKESVTYYMMENGLNCYVGSMRTAWGTFSTNAHREAAPGLCSFFVDGLIHNDESVGVALMNAKKSLINEAKNDVNMCTTFEYECFGDPAFNPYEPCNEGA